MDAVAHATWGDCARASELFVRASGEQSPPEDPQIAASEALCLEASGRKVDARERFKAACRMLADWDGEGAAPILRRSPEYPRVSAQWDEEGAVGMRLHLDADGRVGDVTVEESSGIDELDAASVESVSHWRYCVEEGWQDGAVRVLLQFRLKDSNPADPLRPRP